MKNRICALFLFDGFADWEPALTVANLNKYSDFSILTFSVNGRQVTSMGGLQITPQKGLADLQPSEIDLLIIPGGDAWEQDKAVNQEIVPLVKELLARQKLVAAICGATILLGNVGLLNTVAHTSNGPDYLKQHCPAYVGEAFYQNQPCVSANGIITANGAAMIEFAHEIYKALQLFDDATLEGIKKLYKSGGMVNTFHEQSTDSV